jgi:predicted RNase H-like HicB family nuclease
VSQIIEVIITKRNKTYLATCDVFPNCKGIAETQEEALIKLSKAIGKFIGSVATETFKSTLKSNNYTEVLLDQTDNQNQKKIAFNLGRKESGDPLSFLLKVPAFEDEPDDTEAKIEQDTEESDTLGIQYESILETTDVIDTGHKNDILEQFIVQNKSVKNDPDSYVFGFPLNFN